MKQALSYALLVWSFALLASCSRTAVTTFQPTSQPRYYSALPAPESLSVAPVTADSDVPGPSLSGEDKLAPATLQASTAPEQPTGRALSERVMRAHKTRVTTEKKVEGKTVTPKKVSALERLTLKRIDRLIKKQTAPAREPSLTGYVRLGLILAAIGLLLLLIGNSLGSLLGLLALVGGLVLVIVGLLR